MFKRFVNLIVLVAVGICCMPTIESSPVESRIIGGESTKIVETPYLVSIRYKKNSSTAFEHRCSGTIYSSKVILTTATCVTGLDCNRLHVKAGSSYRSQDDGYLYLVQKYVIHPDYNFWFTDNDLALLVLAFDLNSNVPKEIAPITIGSQVPVAGSSATISGWGITDPNTPSNFSETLQIAIVNFIDESSCKHSYGENRISSAMLCASGNGTDACVGDAGGALVYEGYALGLVSWGNGCANSNFPGVYTNLLHFKEWIQHEVEIL